MACPGQNPLPPHGLDADTIASVQALTGLDVIRRRPGMYVGYTDATGLFHLLFELVTNSLAEVVAGFGNSVRVALRADGSAEVADDGRTLPEGDNVEQVFTVYGAGHHGYRPYGDGRDYLHYVIANALSERLTALVRSDNSRYQHAFRRGVTHAVIQTGGPPNDRGLTIRFLPDPQIFGTAQFDATAIRDRLRQLAFLHSGVRVTFTDETTGTHDEFEYADGIREYVQFLNENRTPLHKDVIVLRGEEEGVRYEVGLQWCEGYEETRRSFANHRVTTNGGTHERGTAAGVALGVRDFMREHVLESGEFVSDDFRTGLTAVVSVWLSAPMFEYANLSRLGSPEAEGVISRAVRTGVREYLEANAETAKRVMSAVVAARNVRIAARAERKKKRE